MFNSTHPLEDATHGVLDESNPHQRSDGRPTNTGRRLEESVVYVRVDETPASNDRVAVHIEHPDHDGGVRCFYRHRERAEQAIRRHIGTEIDADLERVELEDTVGLGFAAYELLPEENGWNEGPKGVFA
ncbi:hypothetical protein [Natronorubrum daqingense]|uniref:Uncharacterized protein n=1 Tax=Natronorubrum daqingense TaxID=588898 RepID=A0A1N7G236_9EURY|nr:hypothetical protein [Natronorubrum daqingense]APX98651.1 hypothetical protein BB347_18345 [Natronorubrum daqingense]SIS06690.1 hypothetical protein SAMN05421809_3687 [Natronorubrum daqingense]